MSDEYSHHVSLEYQQKKEFRFEVFFFYLFIIIFFWGGGGGSFDDAGISLQI